MVKKILCIDDDIRNHLFIRKVIGLTNHKLYETFDGKSGLAIALREELDLILMDIHLAESNGIDLINQFKQSEIVQHIPIVAITADNSKELKQQCFDAGFADVVHRPLSAVALLNTIHCNFDKPTGKVLNPKPPSPEKSQGLSLIRPTPLLEAGNLYRLRWLRKHHMKRHRQLRKNRFQFNYIHPTKHLCH